MTAAPEPNFDRVARVYRWAEYLALGRLLERTREYFLPQLTGARRAFVLGDGDGRFLARLLGQNRDLKALAVDTSASMLHLLRNRCSGALERLQTRQATALDVDAPAGTDLIVTHFFLDCLTQPEVDALTKQLAAQTGEGTLWLVSDFAVPPEAMLRWAAALYIRGLYFAFRILTGLRVTQLPDPQAALDAAGFTRLARREFCHGLLYTELWCNGKNTISR